MISSILKSIASVLALFEWKERNKSIALTSDIETALYEAKIKLFKLEDAGVDGPELDLARIRLRTLQEQRGLIAAAAATYDATRIQTPAKPEDTK